MKIIVGLGNPGRKYDRTRHNAGFLAVEHLADSLRFDLSREKYYARTARGNIGPEEVLLVLPQTFMNDSGRSVAAALRSTGSSAADLIVVHDDLDLPLGTVRIKTGGGHGGHNGLRSIIEYTGSSDFTRIRIGIGRPPAGTDAADYVLSVFSPDERNAATDAILRAVEAVKMIFSDGLTKTMNLFNKK